MRGRRWKLAVVLVLCVVGGLGLRRAVQAVLPRPMPEVDPLSIPLGFRLEKPGRLASMFQPGDAIRTTHHARWGSGTRDLEVTVGYFRSPEAGRQWAQQAHWIRAAGYQPQAYGEVPRADVVSGSKEAPRTILVDLLGPEFCVSVCLSAPRGRLSSGEIAWAEDLARRAAERAAEAR